jgi:uncharacterized membrane protein
MMFYLPVSFLLFLLLLLVLPALWLLIAIDVVKVAATKLGFSSGLGVALLAIIILTSAINIPLYQVEAPADPLEDWLLFHQRQFWGIPFQRASRTTIVCLNLGGGVIPVLLALYQFRQASALSIVLVTAIVTVVCYYAAHVVPGIGIQMNPLLAPLAAVLATLWLASAHAPAIAFAGGILGTLIGADLLHLKDIQQMSSGVLSIGGAGVFDGLVLCGLFALLLS